MRQLSDGRLVTQSVPACTGPGIMGAALLVYALLIASILAACGAASTRLASHAVASPTPAPTLTPTVTPQPNPPLSATAILDVRPASMSLVGHLNCTRGTAYTCPAEVLARSSNQGSLRWFASTSVPGQVVFNPSSGVLAPGQQVMVTITVPLGDCTRGLFFFHGPANTHSIGWTC
jgi:hypothetical protein